jgi:antitoxin component of MazEF toxin-antitoxin module
MIKRLTRVGNGQALLIDKPILEMLGLGEGDRVRLSLSGRALVVMPVEQSATDEQVRAAAARAHKKYRQLFERLA